MIGQEICNRAEYEGAREAMRHLKGGYAKLLRHAILGEIRVALLPGRKPLYHRGDVQRIAASVAIDSN